MVGRPHPPARPPLILDPPGLAFNPPIERGRSTDHSSAMRERRRIIATALRRIPHPEGWRRARRP